VGNAAGQCPDGFHFLGLGQALFQLPFFSYIDAHAEDFADLAGFIINGLVSPGHSDPLTVAPDSVAAFEKNFVNESKLCLVRADTNFATSRIKRRTATRMAQFQ
jgi:hypothetical protein